MRRLRADWMTRTDDEILEWLDEHQAGTPKVIADNLGRNNSYIGQRCMRLTNLGLLDKPSRGFYTINEKGQEYLAGDLDASELE